MAILNFSDVLKNVGLDSKDVKLIRHALSDERFRECYKAGMAHEYTQHQKVGFSKGYSYWITFISDGGTYARLHHKRSRKKQSRSTKQSLQTCRSLKKRTASR